MGEISLGIQNIKNVSYVLWQDRGVQQQKLKYILKKYVHANP